MKEYSAKSPCAKLREITVKFDLFGFMLDKKQLDGLSLYKSILGTLVTLIFLTILLLYSIYTYNSMRLYNDTNIMISTYENYFDDDYVFTARKNGFQVAFGLITYDTELGGELSTYG